VFLDAAFWSERTHEVEAAVRGHLTDPQIDSIIDDVAAVIDENLRRFDPLVAYYGRFAPDGDQTRIEWEREAAHSVKRDLAWAACERAVGEPGFFYGLLPWYDRGRWPVGWAGAYNCGENQSPWEVDDLVAKAIAAGGSTYDKAEDFGFMYTHSFVDPDGHGWGLFHISAPPQKP
jgi:hypothetical protein